MTFQIRPYHPTDLTALYRICLGTGNSGSDGSHLYQDPDLLGHYYAAPYAVLEPDLSFMLTKNNVPIGYVLGVRDTATFGQRCEREWFPPLRDRYPLPVSDDQSRDANMIRSIHRGHDQGNEYANFPAHLHIDILPDGQGQGFGRQMIETLITQLKTFEVPGVFLGVGKKNIRAIGFYQHVGFHKIAEHPGHIDFGMVLTK